MTHTPDVDAAFALLEEGKIPQAQQAFSACVERRAAQSEAGQRARLGYGASLMASGDNEKAGVFFSELPGEVPEYLVNAALAFRRMHDEQRELRVLARLLPVCTHRYASNMVRLISHASACKSYALARDAARKLYEWHPSDTGMRLQLAVLCRDARSHEQAIPLLLELLEDLRDQPDKLTDVHACLAGVYKDIGNQRGALKHFRAAYDLRPSPSGLSNLIMMSQYSHGLSLADFYTTCREYSRRYLAPLPKYVHTPDRAASASAVLGLRIGFVSGDFTSHSLAHLLLEPFKQLKTAGPRHTFSLWNSREHNEKDPYERAYCQSMHFSHNIHGLSDEQVARLIHQHQIDVLVDISGHTALNRLPVFGYQPAPVQAGWVCGMMTPAGVDNINYFFTDKHIIPDDASSVCHERLICMPSAYTYFPLRPAPDVREHPPYATSGTVSFGSLNNPCKLSPAVIRVWAGVLMSTPGSKIKIKTYNEATGKRLQMEFARYGVDASRVVPVLPLPNQEAVLRYYTDEIDIVLEPFPCAGCLTTAEAMWMGCPPVALSLDTFLSRQSVTLLRQAGLDDLVATSEEQYVKCATALASDMKRVARLRTEMRGRLSAAPVRNPLQVAQGVVQACESAWSDWCTKVSRRPAFPVGH